MGYASDELRGNRRREVRCRRRRCQPAGGRPNGGRQCEPRRDTCNHLQQLRRGVDCCPRAPSPVRLGGRGVGGYEAQLVVAAHEAQVRVRTRVGPRAAGHAPHRGVRPRYRPVGGSSGPCQQQQRKMCAAARCHFDDPPLLLSLRRMSAELRRYALSGYKEMVKAINEVSDCASCRL
jgi:hypothetical protein